MPPKKAKQKEPDNSDFDLYEVISNLLPNMQIRTSDSVQHKLLRVLCANCLFSKGEMIEPNEVNCLHMSPMKASNLASRLFYHGNDINKRTVRYYHLLNHSELLTSKLLKTYMESSHFGQMMRENGWFLYKRFESNVSI